MMVLAFALSLSAPWVKIEPFQPLFLDNLCQVQLKTEYEKLSGGRQYASLPDSLARDILQNHLLLPSAWKLAIDVFLKNRSGLELVKLIDQQMGTKLGTREFLLFRHCKSYAVKVLHEKCDFSKSYFEGRSWNQLLDTYRTLRGSDGNIQEMILDNKDVSLCDVVFLATSGDRGSLESTARARNKYSKDYAFQIYYALSLIQYSYRQDSSGKLHTIVEGKPQKYLDQLRLIQANWPTEETPYYLMMKQYQASNLGLAKEQARKYLALEKKPFRVNWVNEAKAVLAM